MRTEERCHHVWHRAHVRMCHLVQIATVHSVAEASEACRIVFESWQGLPQHPQLTNACLGFGI